jgi:hypothetical protein
MDIKKSPIAMSRKRFALTAYALTKKTIPAKIASTPKSRETVEGHQDKSIKFHIAPLDPMPTSTTGSSLES